MIGGHLDSWQGATEQQTITAGSAVMMEVVPDIKSCWRKAETHDPDCTMGREKKPVCTDQKIM
jgi:hypothetical protein